jgi:riboflavin biosynthesis pyrimidine reductase
MDARASGARGRKWNPMSKLLYSATMSLDGFIAGPGGDMSWLTEHLAAPNPGAENLMDEVGALLVGRRTHRGDDPNAGTDEEGAFGGKWSGPVFVLSHAVAQFEPSPGISLMADLDAAVAAAKEAAAGKYVNVLGAGVARSCIEANLLDEIMVYVAPVMIGDGVRLFDHPGGTIVQLEPMDRPHFTGPTGKWFRVRSAAT